MYFCSFCCADQTDERMKKTRWLDVHEALQYISNKTQKVASRNANNAPLF